MIRLQTLGAVDLRRDGTEVRSVLAQPKRLALLACLATRGFTGRDLLLGLFWPEQDEERARNALRQALHYLRKSLGEEVIASRGEREVGIAADVLWCDAAAFDAALAARRLEEALELYRGEFLPGFYLDDEPELERWLEAERTRRHRQAVDAALALCRAAQERSDLAAAAGWARRAAALVPDEEAPIRALLTVLDRSGEAAAARRAWTEFTARLAREYGLEPSVELRRLAERAVSGPAPPAAAAPAAAVAPPAAPASPELPSRGAVPLLRPVRRWPARRGLVAGGALALLFAAVAGITGWFTGGRSAPPRTVHAGPVSIAVLPLVNLGDDPEGDYFTDGVTEEILDALTRIEGLRVASRTSSFAFKGRSVPVDSIGRALRVDHILEGSIRRTGDRIRISVQLVEVADGMHEWSESYDRRVEDVFAVQEEIARAIALALEIRFARAGPASRPHSPNARAYDRYLRGRHLISYTSHERNREAVAALEEALRHDPRFAAAHASLARALIAMAEFVTPADVLPRARASALRALELDSTLVETRLVLAEVRRVLDRDWAAAEAEIVRAIQLDAGSAAAHATYARFLLDARRFAEARRETEKAWAIRALEAPDSLLPAFRQERHISWGGYELFVGNPAQALAHARAALDLDPANVTARWLLALAQIRLGQFAGAVAAFERIRDMTAGAAPFHAQLGYAYGRAGRPAQARLILHELLERASSVYVPRDQIALVHLGLDQPDSALVWLRRAVDDYHWWMPSTNAHPLWAELHDHPHFRALMRSIGAPAAP